MKPGEILPAKGELELNSQKNRNPITVEVANTGDRPIQVGSHYHFFETNEALKFDRKRAKGMRLDIAAGTAVRFEPGQTDCPQLARDLDIRTDLASYDVIRNGVVEHRKDILDVFTDRTVTYLIGSSTSFAKLLVDQAQIDS